MQLALQLVISPMFYLSYDEYLKMFKWVDLKGEKSIHNEPL